MKKTGSTLLAILCCLYGLWAQPTQPVPFNGLITDADGKGIRARIEVKGSEKQTVANRKGQFGLTDLTPADTLVVTFRHNTLEVPVGGRRSLKVVWIEQEPTVEEAPELVDYGLGYVKRREYTASASGKSGAEMVRRGYTDLRSALLGMFPSLRLVQGEIVIRGMSSINSSNAALILCDGSEIHDLNSINIHDVVSVEVQKGSNMYGLRGGNGVILIRTSGKMHEKR